MERELGAGRLSSVWSQRLKTQSGIWTGRFTPKAWSSICPSCLPGSLAIGAAVSSSCPSDKRVKVRRFASDLHDQHLPPLPFMDLAAMPAAFFVGFAVVFGFDLGAGFFAMVSTPTSRETCSRSS